MNKPRPKALTAFAEHGMVISETFRAGVASFALPGLRAELMEPEASTGQGVRSLQHIRLVPENGGLAVTIGSVHVANKRAEVRSYAYVARAFQERFGRPPPFLPAAYENLVQAMERVLRTFMIDVHRIDPAPTAPAPVGTSTGVSAVGSGPRSGATTFVVLLGIVALLLVIAGLVAWKFL